MNSRLSVIQIIILTAFAAGLAGGQMLFKAAALQLIPGSLGERLFGLLQNGFFLAAVVLYAVLSVLWVWVLSFTPLSRAYPFVALGFVLTCVLGAAVFAEPISIRLVIGIILILVGLFLIVS